MSYNIKTIKQEFKDKGIFYTTSEMAEYLKSLVGFDPKEVYDPTCGDGALLSVFGDDVVKYGQEINEHQLDAAKLKLRNFNGICGDTLKHPAFLNKKFECIVANPPFSIAWEPPQLGSLFNDERFLDIPAMPPKSKADYAFLLHIITYLADNGIAVVLNFPGILYRGNSEGVLRTWFVQRNLIEKVIRIPGKRFVDTTIETAVIVFRKNKTNTNIEFVDSESGASKIVDISEISENNYVLSPNTYLPNNITKQTIDPIALQKSSRNQMIARLKADISADKMVCEIEGWNHVEYLEELRELVIVEIENQT